MAVEYTEEQLNSFDKSTLVQLFLVQQSQLKDIDQKLQLLLEQVAVMNNHRYGRPSEKLDTDNQIIFFWKWMETSSTSMKRKQLFP